MKKNKKWMLILISVMLLTAMACGFLPLSLSEVAISGDQAVATLEAVIEEQVGPLDGNEEVAEPSTLPQAELPLVGAGASASLLADIYERVSPGVVSILVWTEAGTGSGSGFVYDLEGHIITNYHVVENATRVQVDFISGLKVWAEIIAVDPDSDIAVLKVAVPASDLRPLPLGSSQDLRVGETVLAIGNPYGLVGTMTSGIVSAKGRTMESLRVAGSGGFFSTGDIIQTDATINPGNSGGPLINLNGEVVGVNRAIQTSGLSVTGTPVNTGIGFAVSIDIVKRVVPVLIVEGQYEYPFLGISAIESLNLLQMELLNIDHMTGAYVTNVVPGSPAELAGVRGATMQVVTFDGAQIEMPVGGDLIIAIDDQPVGVFGDLLSYVLLNKSPGDTINLTVLRDGEQLTLSLTLGSRSNTSQ